MIKIPKSLDELKNMITDHSILDTVKANAAKIMQSSATEHLSSGAESLDQLKTLIQQQLACVKNLGQYIDGLNSQLAQLQTKITQLESQPAQPAATAPAEKEVEPASSATAKDEK